MDAKDFACRSKAETKPQRREPASSSSRTVPIGKRIWTDVEPGKYSCSNNEVSKNVTYPLRHSQHVNREEDGAVQFWRIKDNLQKYFLHCPHWSDEKWKKCMAREAGNKKRYRYCLIHQEQSCTSELFKVIKDPVSLILLYKTMSLFQTVFFKYIYHVGCAINLHSIINSGLILGGKNLSNNRQPVFFLHVDPVDKNHEDPDVIDLNKPRRKRHQDAENCVDISLAVEKGLTFYQTRSNAIILQENTSSLLYPESC